MCGSCSQLTGPARSQNPRPPRAGLRVREACPARPRGRSAHLSPAQAPGSSACPEPGAEASVFPPLRFDSLEASPCVPFANENRRSQKSPETRWPRADAAQCARFGYLFESQRLCSWGPHHQEGSSDRFPPVACEWRGSASLPGRRGGRQASRLRSAFSLLPAGSRELKTQRPVESRDPGSLGPRVSLRSKATRRPERRHGPVR